ncbi:MAG: beta family protein [Pseudomonas sp.]
MKNDKPQYVPVLKWRQGEYQALFLLKDDVKDCVVPLIVIPPREYDFEEQRMKKTIHEHVETFPKRLKQKWSARLAMVDIHESLENETMDDTRPVIDFVRQEATAMGCKIIPIVNLKKSAAYLNSVKKFATAQGCGVALRIKLSELNLSNIDTEVSKLLQSLETPWGSTDLIIDLGNPGNFQPYSVFSKILAVAIAKVHGYNLSRSITLIGTSLNLSVVKKPGTTQTRHEWPLYREFRIELEKTMLTPNFGDYAIESPDFAESMDMRMMKPGGKIVYTTADSWFIPKGGSFRDNNAQMIGHCAAIISSGHYMKRDFCLGDERVEDTAKEVNNCGNLTTWKFVGVNHHITYVVRQLANQYGT